MNEDIQYILAICPGCNHMNSNSQQKQYKIKISIRADIWYTTGSDQWNRKKTSTKLVQQIK